MKRLLIAVVAVWLDAVGPDAPPAGTDRGGARAFAGAKRPAGEAVAESGAGRRVGLGTGFRFRGAGGGAPSVSIDGQPAVMLPKMADSNVSYRLVKMRTGVTHSYQFFWTASRSARAATWPATIPIRIPRPACPRGRSPRRRRSSKIYDGATADYWVYASPGVDPARPSPLMVWQDGQGLIGGDSSNLRLFTVTENLVAQKLLPPMVHVMISPATVADGPAECACEASSTTRCRTATRGI